MRPRAWLVWLLFAALVFLQPVDATAGGLSISDPCRERVPSDLVDQLSRALPDFRLPKGGYSSPEDVRNDREAGGNGCITVTDGDYDGDGRSDVALVMDSRREGSPILVAALNGPTRWRIIKLRTLRDFERARVYVSTLRPGTFLRSESTEGPLEHGEVRQLESLLPGVALGVTESSEIGYFVIRGKWKHVWIAD